MPFAPDCAAIVTCDGLTLMPMDHRFDSAHFGWAQNGPLQERAADDARKLAINDTGFSEVRRGLANVRINGFDQNDRRAHDFRKASGDGVGRGAPVFGKQNIAAERGPWANDGTQPGGKSVAHSVK